ncbi:MAG: S8 family serine peptidase [Planctomycetota bacterium]
MMVAFLVSLYPWAMIVMLLAILVWFFFDELQQTTGLATFVFCLAAVAYLAGLFLADVSWLQKVWLLFRDGLTLLAMIWIGDRQERAIGFMAVGLVLGLASWFFYFDYLESSIGLPASATATAASPTTENDLDPNAELLLDIRQVDDLDQLKQQLSKFGAELSLAFPGLQHPEYSELEEYYAVNVPDNQLNRLDEILNAIRSSGLVDDVERNHVASIPAGEFTAKRRGGGQPDEKVGPETNDPDVHRQWGLNSLGLADYYAWARSINPVKTARIAILDTGVDATHEDLSANFVSLSSQHDSDALGHGTHCAGVACAVSGNGVGIASLAESKFVEVSSIKVLDDNGIGSEKTIIAGIVEAADAGVDVISLSLGGPATEEKQRAEEQAIQYATRAGTLVVVAAGNENRDASSSAPACCEGVIVVSAVDRELNKAQFSNTVSSVEMGVAAPGVDIFATLPGNKYEALSGTSMAAPRVAGLLGMMKSLKPDLDVTQAYEIIKRTGKSTGNSSLTGPLVQPLAALREL